MSWVSRKSALEVQPFCSRRPISHYHYRVLQECRLSTLEVQPIRPRHPMSWVSRKSALEVQPFCSRRPISHHHRCVSQESRLSTLEVPPKRTHDQIFPHQGRVPSADRPSPPEVYATRHVVGFRKTVWFLGHPPSPGVCQHCSISPYPRHF
jgi:hypothetical protein